VVVELYDGLSSLQKSAVRLFTATVLRTVELQIDGGEIMGEKGEGWRTER
jgi:hypothetical protein